MENTARKEEYDTSPANDVEPYSKLETIMPERAKKLLKTSNDSNRKLRARKVTDMVNNVKDGQWKVNGDSIRISVSGKLLDGQHRLQMCVETDTPLKTFVVYDLPDDVFDTIDIGLKRSTADSLYLHSNGEVKWAACIAGGLNVLSMFQRHDGKYQAYREHEKKLSPSDIIKMYDNTPNIDKNLEFCKKMKLINGWISPSTLLGLYAYTQEIDKTLSDRFWFQFETGSDLSEQSPINALRNRLVNWSTMNGGRRANRRIVICMFIKAWNARKKNQALQTIQISSKEIPQFDID